MNELIQFYGFVPGVKSQIMKRLITSPFVLETMLS